MKVSIIMPKKTNATTTTATETTQPNVEGI